MFGRIKSHTSMFVLFLTLALMMIFLLGPFWCFSSVDAHSAMAAGGAVNVN